MPVLKIATEFEVSGHEDVTINRCPGPNNEQHNSLLMLTKFKIGRPTPHEINDCSGPHYILEEHISDIQENQFLFEPLPLLPPPLLPPLPKVKPSACTESTNAHILENLQEEDIVNDRDMAIMIARNKDHAVCLQQSKHEENIKSALTISTFETTIKNNNQNVELRLEPECKV